MKRTTLVLEEACLEAVRELAHQQNRNLSQVINELLAEGLQRRKKRHSERFQLPSYSMGKPRINLGDRDTLEALMDP